MYRIVLADDEALIREGVSENVPWERLGYEFAGSFENGLETLEYIRENPVDVVITDICMPYMDGIKLAEALYSESPDTKVIILSGYDEFDYAKKAIRFHVYEYLLKPITASELSEVLTRLRQHLDEEEARRRQINKLQATWRKGQSLLYSDVLLHLITGSKTEEESRRELQEVGANLDAGYYQVGIAELDVYAKTEYPDEKMKKESALMAFVVSNISEELLKEYKIGEVCQGKDHRAFFLFHGMEKEALIAAVQPACEEIMKQMNLAIHMELNIGLGRIVEELGDIYLSFEDAEKALGWHYLLGGGRIFDETEWKLCEEKRTEGSRQLDLLVEKLIAHLKLGEGEELAEDLMLLQRLFVKWYFDRRSIGTVLQRIVQSAENVLLASEPEEIPEDLSREKILTRLLEAGELSKAILLLKIYLENLMHLLEERKNTGGRRYALMAMDFIEKHYGDSELGLNTVCSYLNISMSRFSTIFKNVTGQTFIDALSNMRMQKAKELLIHTDLKNYEIAEKVGFNDPHYFGIAFKKQTGMTPTEFARSRRKNEETE